LCGQRCVQLFNFSSRDVLSSYKFPRTTSRVVCHNHDETDTGPDGCCKPLGKSMYNKLSAFGKKSNGRAHERTTRVSHNWPKDDYLKDFGFSSQEFNSKYSLYILDCNSPLYYD